MRAIAYVRVSTEEQAQEGVSLEAQENRIQAYCQMQGRERVQADAQTPRRRAGPGGREGRPG